MRSVYLAASLSLTISFTANAADQLTLFSAASTVHLMGKLEQNWQTKSGNRLRTVFASSGALARQIESGAPADLFLSADNRWVDFLVERDLIAPDTRKTVFRNRLALIASADLKLSVPFDVKRDLPRILSGGNRLAIGDPRHVPAGLYAKQSLQKFGLWTTVRPKTARAQNVRLALALVERNEAPLGIVYLSDALQRKDLKILKVFPQKLHAPIAYEIAATKPASELAANFLDYLSSPEAREIYRHLGFITK